MRRGGTLHSPIPRAPAATLQAPFIPIEAEVSVVGSGVRWRGRTGTLARSAFAESELLGGGGSRPVTLPSHPCSWGCPNRSFYPSPPGKELGRPRASGPYVVALLVM